MTTDDQQLLTDPAELRPAPAHQHGTDTEHAAARLVTPRTGTLRARVVAALRGGSYTAGELADKLDAYLYSVAPRLTELQRDGWVEDSGQRRDTARHAAAIVWRLTDDAVDQVGKVAPAQAFADVDDDLGIET